MLKQTGGSLALALAQATVAALKLSAPVWLGAREMVEAGAEHSLVDQC